MLTKIKKNHKLRAYVGLFIIVIGILVCSAGKPNPVDSNLIDPTWQTMLLGAILIVVGYIIGKKHFKTLSE